MAAMQNGPVIVVHGGAGAEKDWEDGCRRAAQAGLDLLQAGQDALAGAVAAVVTLEDDGRFNAGSGAQLALDGVTIEMDAAVMDSHGRQGAVACIERVRNPILVAREVLATPHRLLCGKGAQRLARLLGHGDFYAPTEQARADHLKLLEQMRSGEQALPGTDNAAFERFWNFELPLSLRQAGDKTGGKSGDETGGKTEGKTQGKTQGKTRCDTVGAVTRDAGGVFAVAGSTGGSAPSLLGRVGDTAIVGSGFYAGPLGAIAATGVGEYIIGHMLARRVYQWLSEGMALEHALQRGIDLFDEKVDVGLIAVTADGAASRSNRNMPWWTLAAAPHC